MATTHGPDVPLPFGNHADQDALYQTWKKAYRASFDSDLDPEEHAWGSRWLRMFSVENQKRSQEFLQKYEHECSTAAQLAIQPELDAIRDRYPPLNLPRWVREAARERTKLQAHVRDFLSVSVYAAIQADMLLMLCEKAEKERLDG